MPDFDYRQKAWSAALIVLFFVAWELFCLMTGMSDLVLPRPSQVFVTLFEKFPILWPHILQTLATTMIGFVLGVGLGVVLGAVIGVSKTAYDTAYPLLVGFSSIPKVAVVPIFVLWFGSGSVPAVLTALSICFFPIVVNIATGLATTEPELEDVLKALGASKLDILWNVGLPRTMPFFFASLEGRDLLRLRRRGAVRDRRLEPRHRQRHDDRVLEFQRAAGVRRPVRARRPRRRALRDLLRDRGTRHRLGHPQERPDRDMKQDFVNRHPTQSRRSTMLARVSAALLGVALFAGAASAQETTIKFTLGWKTQGSDAAFFYAKDNGFFKEEGLNVVIDQGEGSGATVTRIMSGAYDAGFGDVNAIIQNASTKPQDAPVMVYMIWNQPPFAIVTKKTSGINTIKDFEGHTLGGAQGTPTTRLLPVFAQKNKLEGEKIKISNMAPNLQEPMLIKGDIDAALVFNITSYFNLVLNRQDPDKDYKWFQFGDYGLDLYSNGVMVSRKLLASNPKAVAGLVRAVNKGMIAIAKDQNAGMKAAVNYDNLINVEVEKRRLQYSFDKLIVSPEMKEIGVGDVKDDRMARAIGIIVEGYQLARAPAPAEIFSREFLPPRAERELVYTAN